MGTQKKLVRKKQPMSLEDRCAAMAAAKLEAASLLPIGAERAQLEREAWQLQTAHQISDWLSPVNEQSNSAE